MGVKPVNVLYELMLRRSAGQLSGHGTVLARYTGLETMWLQPIVMLRLEDGQHIDIAITEVKDHLGKFEIVIDID